jgi:uncharacterized repeat protein (TIGR02543 family)
VPTKVGYTFLGWYKAFYWSGRGVGNPITQIPTGTNQNQEYYASWSMTDYSITYILDHGSDWNWVSRLPSGARTSFNIETLPYTLPIPYRTNHTFVGWFENSDLTGSAVTSIASKTFTNKTYYAKWKRD